MATLPIPFPARKGRPRKRVDAKKILALRARGLSWHEIAKRLRVEERERRFVGLRSVPKVFLNLVTG